MFDFIKAHVSSNMKIQAAIEFTNYQNMRDDFESSELWEDEVINNSIIFWSFAETYASTLSILAR